MIRSRSWVPLSGLAAIAAVTAVWWAFALWPVGSSAPEWVLRTRQVCFGAAVDQLPDAAGWIVLVGQPLGMVGLLVFVWGAELRAGVRVLMSHASGQLATGVAIALLLTGLTGVVVRVRTAGAEAFDTGASGLGMTRVNDAAPAFALTDQERRTVTLDSLRGRPALITFAYAHCATICPVTVSEAVAARRRLGDAAPELVVITLDPWRDTAPRLPSIAGAWGFGAGEHVLSGDPEEVERALTAWRVPRSRNQRTGDITHPAIVYVVSADGRIRYVVNGGVDVLVAALRAL
jgi:cytochrome oxidase Cu insertion factor (SCO1/SenC/PrrC family)